MRRQATVLCLYSIVKLKINSIFYHYMNIWQITWTVLIYATVQNMLHRAPFSLLQSMFQLVSNFIIEHTSSGPIILHKTAKSLYYK